MLGFLGALLTILLLVYVIGIVKGLWLKIIYSLAVCCIGTGILFKIMHWQYGKELMIAGSVVSFLIVGYSYIKKKPKTLEDSTLMMWFIFMVLHSLKLFEGREWQFWTTTLQAALMVACTLFIAFKHFGKEQNQ